MPKTREFIVNREGRIILEIAGIDQCKDVGHTEFEYHAAIHCPSPKLNSRGFVIDHVLIHRAAQTVKRAESCERMCELFHEALVQTFRAEKLKPKRVYIRIRPLPSAAAFTEFIVTY